ncbi:MAG: cytoskeleton protein RodZ [Arenicella sp.]|jgi:cytoskeleton protein RodZ
MEDKQKQADAASPDLQHGSGFMLATARKQQQKTIEEIAKELNLSVTQVKLIELDQAEGLPEPTYVRGYIRGYAKLLGLNPDEVLQNYLNPNWQQTSDLNDIPKGIGDTTEESDDGFFTPAKTIFLLIILGALAYFWYTGTLSDNAGSTPAPSVKSQLADEDDLVAVSPPLTSSPGTDAGSELSDSPVETASEGAKIKNQLALSFTDTSWVDIRDDKDTRLAYKSYAVGELLDVRSELPLRVFIGNAAGVSIEYNGEPFDISQHREGVYAKFSVGETE